LHCPGEEIRKMEKGEVIEAIMEDAKWTAV
jgi:TusA-related sulfurtransferase